MIPTLAGQVSQRVLNSMLTELSVHYHYIRRSPGGQSTGGGMSPYYIDAVGGPFSRFVPPVGHGPPRTRTVAVAPVGVVYNASQFSPRVGTWTEVEWAGGRMLPTIHYTILPIHYTILPIHYTILPIHYTLLTIHYTLLTIHYTISPYTTLYSPYTTLYSLYTTRQASSPCTGGTMLNVMGRRLAIIWTCQRPLTVTPSPTGIGQVSEAEAYIHTPYIHTLY
jgi:hypothetical protein